MLQTLSSYVPVSLVNPSLSSVIHVVIDERDGLILHLRTAKDAGAAKDTQRQSRLRSADSSSSQLRAQTESSSQYQQECTTQLQSHQSLKHASTCAGRLQSMWKERRR